MLFGLDGIPLSEPKTGVGHYTFELARALASVSPADEFEIISPREFLASPDEADWPPNLRLKRVQAGLLGRRWWAIGLARHLKKNPLALFHGTNYEVPLRRVCPSVVTVHDLSLFLHPETHEQRRVRRARRRLPLMLRAATMIVTPTESVRREVIERFHIAPEKIVAVPEATREIFQPFAEEETLPVRKRLGIAGDFLLFVGTIEPRKNLQTLLRAFAEILREDASLSHLQLVICGQKGWRTNEFFALLKESGISERIRLTGYVSDGELAALYSSCRAFIYPSLYEGFGLPPLEAMACGAPVIASRISSHAEVLGEGALFFEPHDAIQLARAIRGLLRDESERLRLALAGRKRAAEFSWERAASSTMEVYREAMRRHKAR